MRRVVVNMHWGLLLGGYWAIISAGTMIALASGINQAYFLVLLLGSIPAYLLATCAIMRRCDPVSEDHDSMPTRGPF